MNYHNIPLLPQRDSLTSMSYMLFQENNQVTYRGTTGAMISWGGYSLWRSKHPGHKMDLSASPQNVYKDAPPPPSPVKACFSLSLSLLIQNWYKFTPRHPRLTLM